MVKDSDMENVDAFIDALDEMNQIVDDAVAESQTGKGGFIRKLHNGILESKVFYSAWIDSEDEVPVNNLHEIAFKGTYTVVADYNSFWGEGEIYISEPVTDPTWLQLAVLANEAIHTTGDFHHIFFEGADLVDKNKAIMLYFGS